MGEKKIAVLLNTRILATISRIAGVHLEKDRKKKNLISKYTGLGFAPHEGGMSGGEGPCIGKSPQCDTLGLFSAVLIPNQEAL